MKKRPLTTEKQKEVKEFEIEIESEENNIRAEAVRRFKIRKMMENSKPKN